jgi:hypothetical protein
VRPGRGYSFALRYWGARAGDRVVANLPTGLAPTTIRPEPAVRESGRVEWVLDRFPSGALTVRGTLVDSATAGSRLRVDAALIAPPEETLTATLRTLVLAAGAGDRERSLSLVGSRVARPGRTVSWRVRYSRVEDGSLLRLQVPAGIEIVSTTPAAVATAVDTALWSVGDRPSGTVSVDALVATDITDGEDLVLAQLVGPGHDTANTAMAVRIDGASRDPAADPSNDWIVLRNYLGWLSPCADVRGSLLRDEWSAELEFVGAESRSPIERGATSIAIRHDDAEAGKLRSGYVTTRVPSNLAPGSALGHSSRWTSDGGASVPASTRFTVPELAYAASEPRLRLHTKRQVAVGQPVRFDLRGSVDGDSRLGEPAERAGPVVAGRSGTSSTHPRGGSFRR